ncbi:FitA-like ribbon-helix-helix domain-containing protein [Anabaena sp. CCY 9910]|uniref:FitA-like ribbon-helix-helix domain-containing protein n=1 Tax=Anabaena sp. CCY 9910 TaxID=3103870 RepID=UPI0039E187E8
MATLRTLDIPDELYAQLQELAKAENSSVEAQVIKILHQALQKIAEEQEKRKNVLKILEENRLRRESLRTDVEWPDSTALIREDRDR